MKKILIALAIITQIPFAYASQETRTLKKGQKTRIELPSNATTGYSWHVQPLAKKSAIIIQKWGYEADHTGRIGSGGKQYWNIKARHRGTAHLILEYKRPWEKDVKPTETKEFIFEVV